MNRVLVYLEQSFGRRSSHCRSAIVALAAAGIFQGTVVIGGEGQHAGLVPQGGIIAGNQSASPSAMNHRLSTWVGPGDVIRITAFPDTGSFISGNYTILDGGFVMLPILGLVQVTHLSIAGLTEHLTNGYSKYLAYPTMQIEPLMHLLLLGGFLRPGMYLVNPLHSLSGALSTAGGTVRDDGLERLRWERGGKVLAANLTAEVEGAKSLWVLGFKSNDQICVTLRSRRDMLPVASFIVSTLVASATLAITLVLLQ